MIGKLLFFFALLGIFAVGLAHKNKPGHVRSKTAQETKAYQFVGYNATMCKGFNGTFPVYGQCGAYYFCQNNYVYYDVCQGALNYNHMNGRCDYPYNVDCTRRGFNWNGFPFVQRPKTVLKEREPRSVADIKAYQFVGYNATMCKGFNGTFPVYGQCDAFYFCQNNYVYYDTCQGALNYNHKNGRCDYPYNVDCTRRGFNWNGFPFVQNNRTKSSPLQSEQQILKRGASNAKNSNVPSFGPCLHGQVNCFVDPCQFAKCNIAGAMCSADYCGGCHDRWYTKSSTGFTEVTHQCRA